MPDEKNPFTHLDTREAYDNPWIRVEEDRIVRPDGSPGIYGRVHFKNRALGIIPVDEAMHTWLVGQYRYTLGEYMWEIPMGGGPLADDPLDSARRELEEETGLTARAWTHLFRIHTSNSVTDEVGHVYLARDLRPGPPRPDTTEVLACRRLPLAEAVEMVRRNEITDAISMAGLLFLDRVLRETGTLPGPDETAHGSP